MSTSQNDKNLESALGDLEKTLNLNALMTVSFEERDEQWRNNFLEALPEANLKLGTPEVVLANDGFPYVQLQTVENNESFKAFVINKELPSLLMQGLGVVINAQNPRPDWVLSYGDIANFELNDTFYTDDSAFTRHTDSVQISPDEKILVGQPADDILPKYLRNQLREFLLHAGIKTPKIMLIARNYEDEQRATQDLVFNFSPAQFANEKAFQDVMRTISWFFPRHYSFMSIEENSISNGFEPL